MTQTQENGEKPNLGLLDPNSGRNFFFSKIWLRQPISEKTNDPILRKFSDGRTDKRRHGQARSDFIERCPTNVERPTSIRYVCRKSHVTSKKTSLLAPIVRNCS